MQPNESDTAPASQREAMMAAVGLSPRSGAVPKSSHAATIEPMIPMPSLSSFPSQAEYRLSGVRPSPGAASYADPEALSHHEALLRSHISAPGDGRTPPVQHQAARALTGGKSNPKGILAQSPGLRGTSYPENEGADETQPQRGCGKPLTPHGHNPVGVDRSSAGLPKVARASQPWAGGHNPVGIGRATPASQRETTMATVGSRPLIPKSV